MTYDEGIKALAAELRLMLPIIQSYQRQLHRILLGRLYHDLSYLVADLLRYLQTPPDWHTGVTLSLRIGTELEQARVELDELE